MSNEPPDEELQDGATDLASFGYLLRFARPWRWKIGGSLVLLSMAAAAGVASAMCLGHLVQRLAEGRRDIAAFAVVILALEILAVVAAYIGRHALAHAASGTIFVIRDKLFAQLERLPMSYFDRQPLGRTVTRLTYDVNGIEDFFTGTLARLLGAGISIVAVVVGMLVTDLRLGAALTLAIVPAVLVTWAIRVRLRHWNREFAHRNSTINARLSEFLNGIPVIRAFGAERWSQQVFDGVVDHHLDAAISLNVLNAWSRPLILGLCYVPLLSLLWFGGQEVLAGTLGLGVFVTFVRFCERFSKPISALAQEIHTVQTAFANADRVTHFLRQPGEDEVLGKDGHLSPPTLRGEVEFRDVGMSYDGQNLVLDGVSFHVRPGEKIGLAGRTGSGKSTTVGLLARLYDYQRGGIYLDGHELREFRRGALRSQMGYVSQDVVIFRGTVRENLTFGAPTVNDDETLRAACVATGMAELLRQRGFDFDSELLDHGANLSVGERQLLALTRVLIKNPSLLILDEATSNIDPGVERWVMRAVNEVMRGRTCFIIAHRLATLRDCDRIFVFRAGKLFEQGTHEELLRVKGYYAELIRSGDEAARFGSVDASQRDC